MWHLFRIERLLSPQDLLIHTLFFFCVCCCASIIQLWNRNMKQVAQGFEWKVSYHGNPLMFHQFECKEKEQEHLYEPHQITSEWTKVQQKSVLKIVMETFYRQVK